MNSITRGIRNAFRNAIRTFSLVVIVGLAIGLALSMLVANRAVGKKVDAVKSSVGNTVSISPAGARGFDGGGTALTETELVKVSSLSHVTGLTKSLSDRLSSTDTSLVSAVDAGSLGQRFNQGSDQGAQAQSGSQPTGGPTQDGASTSGTAGTTTTRTFTPSVTVVGTSDPMSQLSSDAGTGLTIKSGKLFNGSSSDKVAAIGSTLATKNHLKVGSTFTAYGSTITVVAIFDAGNTFSNNQVLLPLKTVQSLSNQAGSITSATATIDSVTNVAAATKLIQSTLGISVADVTNSVESADTAVASLKNIQTISLYSLIGAVIAGAVIILLTMIMIARERKREIGVFKAIGASNAKVMLQFVSEAVTLTILGAVVGIVLGALTAKPITNMLVSSNTSSNSSQTDRGPGAGGPGRQFGQAGRFVSGGLSNINATVGWSIIVDGLGAAIVIALVGSGAASFFIAKVRPAEVMRAE